VAEIKETSVTIDYEADICWVDTTQQGVVTRLKRCGFKELSEKCRPGYWRFTGKPKQVSFRAPAGRKPPTPKQVAARATAGARLRANTVFTSGKRG